TYRGSSEADLVICQAVLEHVADTGSAMSCIASMLKPGGVALLFIPSRNAAFARLNLALPSGFKRALLHGLYPSTRFGRDSSPIMTGVRHRESGSSPATISWSRRTSVSTI